MLNISEISNKVYNCTVNFFKEQDNKDYGKHVKKICHKLLDISKEGIRDFVIHYKTVELYLDSAYKNISDMFCNRMVKLGEFIDNYSVPFSDTVTWFLPKQPNKYETRKEPSAPPEELLPSTPPLPSYDEVIASDNLATYKVGIPQGRVLPSASPPPYYEESTTSHNLSTYKIATPQALVLPSVPPPPYYDEDMITKPFTLGGGENMWDVLSICKTPINLALSHLTQQKKEGLYTILINIQPSDSYLIELAGDNPIISEN